MGRVGLYVTGVSCYNSNHFTNMVTVMHISFNFTSLFHDGSSQNYHPGLCFPHVSLLSAYRGGTAKEQLHTIKKVINFTARVITGTRKFDHITPALNSLGWQTIEASHGGTQGCPEGIQGTERRELSLRDPRAPRATCRRVGPCDARH